MHRRHASNNLNRSSQLNIFSDINNYKNSLFQSQVNERELRAIKDSMFNEYQENEDKLMRYKMAMREDDLDELELELKRKENERVFQQWLSEKKRLEYEEEIGIKMNEQAQHEEDVRNLEHKFSNLQRTIRLFVKNEPQNGKNCFY